MLQAFLKDDSGASAIEYAFVAVLISVAILASVMSLGDSIDRTYASVNDDLAVAAGMPATETPGKAVTLEPVLDGVAIASN
ncbi:MAG: Flp family type IVb pilin [Alphaproteobacteria bacterium]